MAPRTKESLVFLIPHDTQKGSFPMVNNFYYRFGVNETVIGSQLKVMSVPSLVFVCLHYNTTYNHSKLSCLYQG